MTLTQTTPHLLRSILRKVGLIVIALILIALPALTQPPAFADSTPVEIPVPTVEPTLEANPESVLLPPTLYHEVLVGVEWSVSSAHTDEEWRFITTATPSQGFIFEGNVPSVVFTTTSPRTLGINIPKPSITPTLAGLDVPGEFPTYTVEEVANTTRYIYEGPLNLADDTIRTTVTYIADEGYYFVDEYTGSLSLIFQFGFTLERNAPVPPEELALPNPDPNPLLAGLDVSGEFPTYTVEEIENASYTVEEVDVAPQTREITITYTADDGFYFWNAQESSPVPSTSITFYIMKCPWFD